MARAALLLREAENTTDPALRYANGQLAAVYSSMARELRIAGSKSRSTHYRNIEVDDIGPLRAPQPGPADLEGPTTLPQPPLSGPTERQGAPAL